MPSIDTVYDDLRRFGATELDKLRGVITKQGLLPVQVAGMRDITIDIDTSVTPLFGEQKRAVVGYNPRFQGRPSFPPILARIAETDTVLGARLRPGNTTLGKDDAKDIEQADLQPRERRRGDHDLAHRRPRRLRQADETSRFSPIPTRGLARRLSRLRHAHHREQQWASGSVGRPRLLGPRLVHQRLASRHRRPRPLLRRPRRHRAAHCRTQERLGIGKASTSDFDAAFLLKLLAYNLMRRWVVAHPLKASEWRASWIRRARLTLPARLPRSGGRWELRLARVRCSIEQRASLLLLWGIRGEICPKSISDYPISPSIASAECRLGRTSRNHTLSTGGAKSRMNQGPHSPGLPPPPQTWPFEHVPH